MNYATKERARSCSHDSQLRRSAIVANRARANQPLLDDPGHQPMLETRRREEGLDRDMPGGPSDAYLKYACPAPGKFTPLRKATVKPVRIAKSDGSDPTAAPDLSVAKSIFRKCCVDLSVEPVTTVKKTAWQTIDSFGSGVAATTPEQQDLALDQMEDYKITVISIRDYKVGGRTTTTAHGGASTLAAGTEFPVIIAVDSVVPWVIAHETGHALAFMTEDTNDTVMKPTSSPTAAGSDKVSADVCRAVRFGGVVSVSSIPCCLRGS